MSFFQDIKNKIVDLGGLKNDSSIDQTNKKPEKTDGFFSAVSKTLATTFPNQTERFQSVKKSIQTRSFSPFKESLKKQMTEMDRIYGESIQSLGNKNATPEERKLAFDTLSGPVMGSTDGGGAGLKNVVQKSVTPVIKKGVFNAQEYVAENIAKREAARVSAKPSLMQKIGAGVKNLKTKFVESTAPVQDVLDDYVKKNKIDLPPSKDISNSIDRVYRSRAIASDFANRNGLVDVIKNVDDIDAFDEYLIAKQATDVNTRGFTTGRDIAKDDELIKALRDKYEPQAQVVKDYTNKLLDNAVDSGLVSKKDADYLKEIYPNYVPINRVFNELEKADNIFNTGGGIANVSKQNVVKKLQGSERAIESPTYSLIKKTYENISQSEKNRAFQTFTAYKDLPGNPFNITPLRTAEDVTQRIDLFTKAKELKPIQASLNRFINTQGRRIRNLQREVNKLNITGLKSALSFESRKDQIPKLIAKLKTKIIPEELKITAPKSFDELLNNYATKDLLQKEYGTFDNLLLDVKMGGWSRLEDVGVPKKIAESVATQVFKSPIYKPKQVIHELQEATLKRGDVKKYINELILNENTDLNLIKRKIATRENKLGPMIDDIIALRNEFNNVKGLRGKLIDEGRLLKDAETKGKSIISGYKEGIKEIYEVPKEVEKVLKGLNPETLGRLEKIMAYPVRVFKLGTTGLNPAFILKNLTRDQFTAAINSDKAFKTSIANPKVWFKGFMSAIKKDELYDDFISGGGGGTSFDVLRETPELTTKAIRSTRSKASRIKYLVTHPGDLQRALEDIVSVTENATRLQQYKGTLDDLVSKGMPLKEAKIQASRAARENTANFARHGEYGKNLNKVFPYLNAGIQGSRASIRAAIKNPAMFTLKVGSMVMMPETSLTFWNMSDEKRRAAYMDIPEYEKEANFIFIPNDPTQDKDGKWNVIKIPKPPGISNLTNLVRRPIEQYYGANPVKFKEIADSVIGSVSPVEPNLKSVLSTVTPQIIRPSVESSVNQNLFTGFPIVPRSMEGLSPELQVKEGTTATAQGIAKLYSGSPVKTEAWIRSTFGQAGFNLLNASDKAAAGLGIIDKKDIGGQSFAKAVVSAFAKAGSGEVERGTNDKLYKVIQKQKDDRFKLKIEAEIIYEELEAMTKEQRTLKFKEIKKSNPELAAKIRDTNIENKKGLTRSDRLLIQLGVANKARATYIVGELSNMKTGAEKSAYMSELKKKGIVSDEVDKQVKAILKANKSK